MSVCLQKEECVISHGRTIPYGISKSEIFCARAYLGKTAKEHGKRVVMIPTCTLLASSCLWLKNLELQAEPCMYVCNTNGFFFSLIFVQ